MLTLLNEFHEENSLSYLRFLLSTTVSSTGQEQYVLTLTLNNILLSEVNSTLPDQTVCGILT